MISLITADLEAKLAFALRNAMCDDYCFVDNCERCNRARMAAVLPILYEIPVAYLRQRWLEGEKLVADGVKHPDYIQGLTELLTALGSPPKRKPRI